MIAYPATISGANLILPSAIHLADRRVRAACGRGSSHAACRHVRACRPMGHDPEKWRPVFSEKIMLNYRSSDGSSLPTRRRSMGGCGVVTCGHRPIQKVSELKSPPPVSRRGLNSCDAGDMPVICPTAQAVFFCDLKRGCNGANCAEGATKFGRRPIQEVPGSRNVKSKRPATVSPARAKSFDAEHMQVICPTCQIFSNSVGRDARAP
jgi:hypothetical protein